MQPQKIIWCCFFRFVSGKVGNFKGRRREEESLRYGVGSSLSASQPSNGSRCGRVETCAIFLPACLPQDSHPKHTYMATTITISGTRISTTLYFRTEEGMIHIAAKILAQSSWNSNGGRYKLVMKAGSRETVYFSDIITVEAFKIIHAHVVKWNAAREAARQRVGSWVWRYGPEYLKRKATLLQIERMKSI